MHVSYKDTVNKIAKANWGDTQSKSEDDAEKKLINDNATLTSMALVELLNRFNKVAAAVGDKEDDWAVFRRFIKVHESEDPTVIVGAKAGDILYKYKADEGGLCRYVVFAVDEKHRCLVVAADDFDLTNQPTPEMAEDMYATSSEAVLHAVTSELEYHSPRTEFALAAKKAAENNGDLTPYKNGFPE